MKLQSQRLRVQICSELQAPKNRILLNLQFIVRILNSVYHYGIFGHLELDIK